jgi:DNA processing protein
MDKSTLALLMLRSVTSRMPPVYAQSLTVPDPLATILTRPDLALQWPALAHAVCDGRIVQDATDDLARWAGQGIGTITIADAEYPALLRTIFDPPPLLFVKGTLSPIRVGLAVVGSRRADEHATAAARALGRDLAAAGAVVVSGLALGVDAAAHHGALEATVPYPTVAILGTGVDRIYPAANRELARRIVAAGGALVSQFEPGSAVYPSNFLARNQIIAGLCCGTVIIQAAKSSGSLATARFALEEGRDVFVVPGGFGDSRYEGSHQLLRDGAIITTAAEDVLRVYPELVPPAARSAEGRCPVTNPTARQIVGLLQTIRECDADAIAAQLALESATIESALLELELMGAIDRLPGNRLRLAHLNLA